MDAPAEVGPVVAVRSMVRADHHDTYVVFLADHVGGEPAPDEHEFDRLEWFDAERYSIFIRESMRKVFGLHLFNPDQLDEQTLD